MSIIYALVVGLVVGALAKLVMPGKDPGGVIVTALLGMAGSMLAFVVGRYAGWYHPGDSGPGIVAAILGAIVVLAGYRMIVGRKLAM